MFMVRIKAAREGSWMMPLSSLSRMEVLPRSPATHTQLLMENAKVGATITGYEDVPTNNEASLMKAVANQPVSVAVDGGDMTFQFYSGGVMTGSCDTNIDHGIAAIGYQKTNDGTSYCLRKNSWGASWGENGYLRMEDIADKKGMCGLAMEPSYPTK
uniref:Uncharacterized protein n=1 Tax=Avena sativa TaxID=4498 RepID=A0ACD5Z074_AVESA